MGWRTERIANIAEIAKIDNLGSERSADAGTAEHTSVRAGQKKPLRYTFKI
jgi:hypothetical protein